jgi:hypothetical protein
VLKQTVKAQYKLSMEVEKNIEFMEDAIETASRMKKKDKLKELLG